MDTPGDYFDAWIKAQQQAFAAMREQSQLMQSMMHGKFANNDPFSNWTKAAMEAFTGNIDAGLGKDTFGKTLFGNESMQKLYELWQPLLAAMRDKSFDSANYRDYLDADKMQALISKLFNFDLGGLSQMQQQAAHYAEWYAQYGKPWADATKMQFANFSPADLQPEAWLKQLQTMSGNFGSAASKVFSIPAIGKDREKIELFARWAKAVAEFAERNLDYQKLMQSTGQQAMQEVLQTLAAKLQAGEKFERFDDFFNLWIEINEKTFNELFKSRAFSQKRNALTDAGFKARKLYNTLLEDRMAEFPIARRSEMDELYKLIHELRRQVKQLQSQVKTMNERGQAS